MLGQFGVKPTMRQLRNEMSFWNAELDRVQGTIDQSQGC